MKKFAVFTVLLVIGLSSVKAQSTFTLIDLEYMSQYNPAEFETDVLKKDFYIVSQLSNDTMQVFFQKVGLGKTPASVSRTALNDIVTISFCTPIRAYYLDFIEQLKQREYENTQTIPMKVDGRTCMWHYYNKGRFNIKMYTNEKEGNTFYTVIMSRAKSIWKN